MKNTGRYFVPESEDYEPNSHEEVLKNYLHIVSKSTMDKIESSELQRTELELEDIIEKSQTFTAQDICNFHELWLGDVYPFAGKYRTVSLFKDGFPFAAPDRISQLMRAFEKQFLAKYTPCHEVDREELAMVLGITHAEFIIIHPFREGNGRLGRLLANLMAMQADFPPLNYISIDQTKMPVGFKNYIQAIHAAFSGNGQPIQKVFSQILQDSIA